MKLADVNVLLYAANADSPSHARAYAWLDQSLAAPAGVAFSWMALLGFVRLATRPGIFPRPLPVATAFDFVRAWLSHPHARIVNPGRRHAALLEQLLRATGAGGNLTSDAHLAALAIEHGATLTSFDRDFARFEGLDFEQLRP
ncbi:MAG: type II toxin-antitoxin system VapC family toxin [Betaproteobacteria bacterium]|jgi:toxin-antitoxin system PIN domain toxin